MMANANAENNKSVAFVAPTLMALLVVTTHWSIKPSLTVNIAKAIPTGYSFPGAATIDYGQRLSEAVFTVPGTGAGTFKFANGDTTPVAVGYFHLPMKWYSLPLILTIRQLQEKFRLPSMPQNSVPQLQFPVQCMSVKLLQQM